MIKVLKRGLENNLRLFLNCSVIKWTSAILSVFTKKLEQMLSFYSDYFNFKVAGILISRTGYLQFIN